MMQNLLNQIFLNLLLCFASSCYALKVGIILPIEHPALQAISQGFQETLRQLYQQPISFKVSNAQGDINLQRAIITQMRDANYDLIVPIATATTQMAATIITTKPLIGLAVEMNEHKPNLVLVDDEIDSAKIMAFIQKTYPKINQIVLVHSATNKIFTQVAQIKTMSKLQVRDLMVQNLADLYSIGQAIPADAQAIFVLKDNLIVSGIETLVKIARERKLLLIAADEGSVQKGADVALGVHERAIGVAGAKLALQVLRGAIPGQLATIKLTDPVVFINPAALASKQQSVAMIRQAARQLNYPVVVVNQ